MSANYKFSLLKTLLNLKVNSRTVWKKRVHQQTQFIHLLEEAFSSEISTQSFGFYPQKVYFSTPLTADILYTKKMKPAWLKIKQTIERQNWKVYAPFAVSDPHAKSPDNLTSYQIRDLDHIQVLTAEVALFDLNRPSHGVGQEIEMSVFMPKVGFSREKVSRMVKGMPGLLLLKYDSVNLLAKYLQQIFSRTSFRKDPFYLESCPQHATKSIWKGNICLNCEYKEFLHTA